MSGPRKVPVEVVERARAAALTKQYTIAPSPQAAAPPSAPKKKAAREKVLAALKKLHPMD